MYNKSQYPILLADFMQLHAVNIDIYVAIHTLKQLLVLLVYSIMMHVFG